MLAYLGIVPVILTAFACVKRKKLHKKKYEKRCGAFLDGTKYKDEGHYKSALAVVLLFFFRRLILCLVLVLWHDFFWGQVASQLMVTTAVVIYLQW